jgi:hypothetical protein
LLKGELPNDFPVSLGFPKLAHGLSFQLIHLGVVSGSGEKNGSTFEEKVTRRRRWARSPCWPLAEGGGELILLGIHDLTGEPDARPTEVHHPTRNPA